LPDDSLYSAEWAAYAAHSRTERVNSEFEPQYSWKLQNECTAVISKRLILIIRVPDAHQGT
jgi:hypothetical protein